MIYIKGKRWRIRRQKLGLESWKGWSMSCRGIKGWFRIYQLFPFSWDSFFSKYFNYFLGKMYSYFQTFAGKTNYKRKGGQLATRRRTNIEGQHWQNMLIIMGYLADTTCTTFTGDTLSHADHKCAGEGIGTYGQIQQKSTAQTILQFNFKRKALSNDTLVYYGN